MKNSTTNMTSTVKGSENLGGNKTMKNRIKENRLAEVAAREEARKAEARKARLDAIEPIDIVDTMDEVANDIAHSVRDEEGNSLGVNGGKLYQTPIRKEDGTWTTIAAGSPEALNTLKTNIEDGLSGDGRFHKLVYINGMPCDCVGSTLEELEEDIKSAENYAKAHINGSVSRDLDVAEQLVDAGYIKEDLEQVVGDDGDRYLICYDGNYIMTLDGETVVNLEDLKSNLCREDVKKLLIDRLNSWIEENIPDCDDWCDDYDDDWYDDDEEDWDEDDDEIY